MVMIMNNIKLHLSEEIEEPIEQPEYNEPTDEEIINFNITSFVTDLIKNKWEQVDQINGILIGFQGDEGVTETLKDIISDEYVHIGQLERIIQATDPEAANLDTEVTE